jgi:WD40 repeat protein
MSGHTSWVTAVAVSEDGKFVASGSDDRTVRVWEATTGTEVYSFANHGASSKSVAFSGNNKLVVSGSGATVQVWDVVTGTHLCTISDHEGSVSSVAFSDDNSLIISGCYYDETIRIWDAATGTHLRTIVGYTGGSVAFSSDGKSIISRRRDGIMQVWEANSIFADSASTFPPQYVSKSPGLSSL